MSSDELHRILAHRQQKNVFGIHYDATVRELKFKERFCNGEYFAPLMSVKLPLVDGEVIRMHTGMDNRRRVLVIKTPLGNVVIFDQYPDGDCSLRGDAHLLGCNVPQGIKRLLHGIATFRGTVEPPNLQVLLGRPHGMAPNIGYRLDDLRRSVGAIVNSSTTETSS